MAEKQGKGKAGRKPPPVAELWRGALEAVPTLKTAELQKDAESEAWLHGMVVADHQPPPQSAFAKFWYCQAGRFCNMRVVRRVEDRRPVTLIIIYASPAAFIETGLLRPEWIPERGSWQVRTINGELSRVTTSHQYKKSEETWLIVSQDVDDTGLLSVTITEPTVDPFDRGFNDDTSRAEARAAIERAAKRARVAIRW